MIPAERLPSPPRRLRACVQCVKAKARCHYENHELEAGCDRCKRLNTACTPQTTKGQRRTRLIKTKPNSVYVTSRTLNLGHSLIPSRSNHDHSDGAIPYCPDKSSSVASKPEETLLPSTAAIVDQGERDITAAPRETVGLPSPPAQSHRPRGVLPHHPRNPSSNPIVATNIPSDPGFGLRWDQAEAALSDFISGRTAHFPFVILDHDITAQRLFVENPLLFRAIMLIATHVTLAKRREIKRSINAWIGQHLLVLDGCSIGTLQGLLVLITWSNPDYYRNEKSTQLMFLAVGLAHRLGITRRDVCLDDSIRENTKLVEECRTFLACYYMFSCSSKALGWSSPLDPVYADKCNSVLDRASEFPSDFLACKMIRYRRFQEEVPLIYEKLGHDTSDATCFDLRLKLLEMKRRMEDLMSDVSWKHPKLFLIWTLKNTAILELHIHMTYHSFLEGSEFAQLQLSCMETCLQICKEAITMFRSISYTGILAVPFMAIQDMMIIGIAMARLLLIDIPSWDLCRAKELINPKIWLQALLALFDNALRVRDEQVASASASNPSCYRTDGPNEEDGDVLHVTAKKLAMMRDWFDFQLGEVCRDDAKDGNSDAPTKYQRVRADPKDAEWNIGYFFESVMKPVS